MNIPQDGGPAFPRPSSTSPIGVVTKSQEGMSLRAWFAGQALNAVLLGYMETVRNGGEAPTNETVADQCLKIADVLISKL